VPIRRALRCVRQNSTDDESGRFASRPEDIRVTMDRYGHLFKSDDHKKAMNAIAEDVFR
jgi:hypothetical protein